MEIKFLDLKYIDEVIKYENMYFGSSLGREYIINDIKDNPYARYLMAIEKEELIGYIGDVQVLFGDDSNLHEKMENVYRIILDDDIRISKGYINVSFNGAPVIKIEEVEENDEKINEESLEGTIDTVE